MSIPSQIPSYRYVKSLLKEMHAHGTSNTENGYRNLFKFYYAGKHIEGKDTWVSSPYAHDGASILGRHYSEIALSRASEWHKRRKDNDKMKAEIRNSNEFAGMKLLSPDGQSSEIGEADPDNIFRRIILIPKSIESTDAQEGKSQVPAKKADSAAPAGTSAAAAAPAPVPAPAKRSYAMAASEPVRASAAAAAAPADAM